MVKNNQDETMGNQQPSDLKVEGSTTRVETRTTQVSWKQRATKFGRRYSLNYGESHRCLNGFYVYIFLNPLKPGFFKYDDFEFDYEPFYVGKGSGRRIKYHLYNRVRDNKHKVNTITKILQSNLLPIVVYEDSLEEQDSFSLETHLINTIGKAVDKKGSLTNILNGGEGVSGLKQSENSKLKISKSLKGRKKPQGHGEKIGLANKRRLYNANTARLASERMKLNNPMKRKENVKKALEKKKLNRQLRQLQSNELK